MIRKLVLALTSLLTVLGFSVVVATPAFADYVRVTDTVSASYCHGGNCNVGYVIAGAAIRQWVSSSNGAVLGTEAICSIQIQNGASRVQVDRTALGVTEGGPALWVDDTDHNSNGARDAINIQPTPNRYVNTIHDINTSQPSDWDIRDYCQFSIRWADGQLAPGLLINSNISHDYYCADQWGLTGPPCRTEYGP